jgi:hypothetical protein
MLKTGIREIMKHLLLLFAASSLAACSLNEQEVVILIETNNDRSTSVLGERSVNEEGEEFDLQLVFGDHNKSISCWSNRRMALSEEEEQKWTEFQEEVREELASRFDVSLRPGLEQADFVEALRATLELSGFNEHFSGGTNGSRSTRDGEAEVKDLFNNQEWQQRTSVYNR